MFWHRLADMGKFACLAAILMCVAGGLTFCSTSPQPRAAGVVRVFGLLWVWSHLLWPTLQAAARTFVLTSARKGAGMDGLLNVYSGLMSFPTVGVQTPEFLSWRIQKITQEEELLRLVYEAADGACGTIPEMVREELENEAEHFTEHMDNGLVYPSGQLALPSAGADMMALRNE